MKTISPTYFVYLALTFIEDLRALPDSVLRSEIVLITQENFLFEGTVADNIRLGRPSASDHEVEQAARAIGAHDFIAALPSGSSAPVGSGADGCRPGCGS